VEAGEVDDLAAVQDGDLHRADPAPAPDPPQGAGATSTPEAAVC
jgi:hypothetical protein